MNLIVRVAPDAQLTVNGKATTLTGAVRRFRSPPLPAARHGYKLQATWNNAGQELQAERQISFQAGQTVEVDLRTSDSPPKPQTRAFKFLEVAPVDVDRGETESFTVRIRRMGFDEPVKLTMTQNIPGVTFVTADIPAGMESAKVTAAANAVFVDVAPVRGRVVPSGAGNRCMASRSRIFLHSAKKVAPVIVAPVIVLGALSRRVSLVRKVQ